MLKWYIFNSTLRCNLLKRTFLIQRYGVFILKRKVLIQRYGVFILYINITVFIQQYMSVNVNAITAL